MKIEDVKEVIEIDTGNHIEEVNRRLDEGWVLLQLRKVGRQDGSEYIEFPVYVLGKN